MFSEHFSTQFLRIVHIPWIMFIFVSGQEIEKLIQWYI